MLLLTIVSITPRVSYVPLYIITRQKLTSLDLLDAQGNGRARTGTDRPVMRPGYHVGQPEGLVEGYIWDSGPVHERQETQDEKEPEIGITNYE